MNNMDQLMQKLAVSKAIMDKQDNIKRGDVRNTSMSSNIIEDFSVPQAKYNIPQEFLQEQPVNQPYLSEPRENTKPVGVPSVDAIKNSKLPDEIKKLMMEHPIAQAQNPNPTLSNDLIERASRLMKGNTNNYIPESASTKQKTPQQPTQQQISGIDYKILKKIVKEVVDESLSENGLMMESSEKTNELFSFKVGKHIFEGKVTKIKKLS